jgi:hypothetical protein
MAKYTSAPDINTSPPKHCDTWKEVEKYAKVGRVWCKSNYTCSRLCFCSAIANCWHEISKHPFPLSLLHLRSSSASLASSQQDPTSTAAGMQQTQASPAPVAAPASPQANRLASPIASSLCTSTDAVTTLPAADSASNKDYRVITPSVFKSFAGGLQDPLGLCTSPIRLEMPEMEAELSDTGSIASGGSSEQTQVKHINLMQWLDSFLDYYFCFFL